MKNISFLTTLLLLSFLYCIKSFSMENTSNEAKKLLDDEIYFYEELYQFKKAFTKLLKKKGILYKKIKKKLKN